MVVFAVLGATLFWIGVAEGLVWIYHRSGADSYGASGLTLLAAGAFLLFIVRLLAGAADRQETR